MIGVDTNVFVRFIVEDGTSQHEAARRFFAARTAEDPVFVNLIVLAETVWVLRRTLGFSQADVCNVLNRLLQANAILFEEQPYLEELFLSGGRVKGDIADHLIAHVGRRRGCSQVVTFDRAAARDVSFMTLLA